MQEGATYAKRTMNLIINLTMADLLVGAVTGAWVSLNYREIELGHGVTWRGFIILIFTSIFPLASQANPCLISFERLHATLLPFRNCLIEDWFYLRIIIGIG